MPKFFANLLELTGVTLVHETTTMFHLMFGESWQETPLFLFNHSVEVQNLKER